MESVHDQRQLSCGVYTKTVVQSPVIHWILQARIRDRNRSDVVFVGDDFIQVSETGREGHLEPIATKADFDARILAAKTFNIEIDDDSDDFLVKLENERDPSRHSPFPPQVIVLTLDCHDLIFIYLRPDHHGAFKFVHQLCPMPVYDRVLFQPGKHLAIDPYSRALAVAASEREVILYSAKSKQQTQYEIEHDSPDWCPVSNQRQLSVDGVILHIDFLTPPTHDTDHIILLLIVVEGRRTKAVRVDWFSSAQPSQAQVYPGQPLSSANTVPNLLIPLRDAAFLLVTGEEIVRWKDILSGAATHVGVQSPEEEARYPGNSPLPPVWANWARPGRSQAFRRQRDHIYLVREDGLMCLLTINASGSVHVSNAGDLDCHVGTAFASLGVENGPDVLAVAGETSSGSVVSIGPWPSARRHEELTREETFRVNATYILQNWASVTDMLCGQRTSSSRAQTVHTNRTLVTSGRQPFGSVTEVRQGIEARISVILNAEDFPDLRNVIDIWALPSSGSVILVISMPSATLLTTSSADFDDIGRIDEGVAFDTDHRTLCADLTATGVLVQITSRRICSSSSLYANFEDTSRTIPCNDSAILAGAVTAQLSIAVTVERRGQTYRLCYYKIPSPDDEPSITCLSEAQIESEPIALTATEVGSGVVALIATADGHLWTALFNGSMGEPAVITKTTPSPAQQSSNCDSVAILRPRLDSDESPALLAVCGLRDGRLLSFQINVGQSGSADNHCTTDLGYSSIKLVTTSLDQSSACAMTGADTFVLKWDGKTTSSLEIENMWLTDKQRLEYSQGSIVAATQMPAAVHLASPTVAESLVFISEGDLIIASLEHAPSTIPRQIPVRGSPNRLIYADSLRAFVCASLQSESRLVLSRSQSTADERRQIWPIISFLSARNSGLTICYDMQPGERVHSLLEWTYRPTPDKRYTHILVGGSYIRRNGTRRGRVAFLQPKLKSWDMESAEITETRHDTFDDDVYALALYDSLTYIACAGKNVYVRRFSPEEKKWEQPCEPFEMHSPGAYMTIEVDHSGRKLIVISTMRDSLVTLEFEEIHSAVDGSVRSRLIPITLAPRADSLSCHHVLDNGATPYSAGNIDQFAFLSTKTRTLLGMASPKSPPGSTRHKSGYLVFEASLPRSLIRLSKVSRPKRIPSPPAGVVPDYTLGSATDGAMIGIILLEPQLQRRLSWLQRLVEWSEDLSPHAYLYPRYKLGDVDDNDIAYRDRALPMGFAGETSDIAILHTTSTRLNDMHIDGDIVARVLKRGGVQAVEGVLRALSEREDGLGAWIRQHLDEELERLSELVDIVRRLDQWM